MLWLILTLFIGFGAGLLLRGRVKLPTGTITLISICLLLFFLGMEIGSDKELISNLPTMGLTSLIVSVGGILGSSVLAKVLSIIIQRNKARKAQNSAGNGKEAIR
ncbi:MAG: LysO family transporter [Bacteroidales bacterium]|nr:LysO family transporter [Candidatus Cacconaster caballi]